jgi:hypothetical protein
VAFYSEYAMPHNRQRRRHFWHKEVKILGERQEEAESGLFSYKFLWLGLYCYIEKGTQQLRQSRCCHLKNTTTKIPGGQEEEKENQTKNRWRCVSI